MGEAYEGGFELGGGEVDAGFQHAGEESGVAVGTGGPGLVEIVDGSVGEEGGEHRAGPLDEQGHAGGDGGLGQARLELRSPLLERLVGVRSLERAQRRQSGGDAQGIPGEGAGLVDGARRGDHLHQVPPPTVGADRQAPADGLAERRQVGLDAEGSLRAGPAQAEAGDHLVEHQERAGLVAAGPDRLQKTRTGRHDAHVGGDRLHDHRRDLAAEPGEGIPDRLRIVVGSDDGPRPAPLGHTR